MIRPYRDADAHYLAPIHTAVFPDNPFSESAFHNYITSPLATCGHAWIIEKEAPLGYALTAPVPGLPHIADLKGCIAPAHRRRGLGTSLLHRVIEDLQGTAVRQLAHMLLDLQSPAAHFLRRSGFYSEHEEYLLRRDTLAGLPQPYHAASPAVKTYPRSRAIDTFATLFAASFSGLPWDQPYTRQEITAVLANPKDLLFLTLDAAPIGFAWLHLEANGLGIIEPLGILPAYQGQGYGRFLLLSAMHELARRGAARVQIGAWRANHPAIHLYHSLGFNLRQTITYLAYDLDN
jgi:mycothiol synthase